MLIRTRGLRHRTGVVVTDWWSRPPGLRNCWPEVSHTPASSAGGLGRGPSDRREPFEIQGALGRLVPLVLLTGHSWKPSDRAPAPAA